MTTGGGPNGQAAIVVLPDTDHDGLADAPITYLSNVPSTQGMLFADGHFYYQDATKILRVPYASGDHAPSGAPTTMIDITQYTSALHWSKAIDQAKDGTIYVTNAGDQGEVCDPTHPFHGGIVKIDGTPGGAVVAKGLRNPLGLRCQKDHNVCVATELTKDYTATAGGRDKLVPVRQGDDWGYPCCATKNTPFGDIAPTDCSGVAQENVSFSDSDTPFDVDFGPGSWPAPWGGAAFVSMHGATGSWMGTRVVKIGVDPETGGLIAGTDLPGSPSGSMADFATGWDDSTLKHGRPSALAFSADGRLFVANDTNGDIFWIAPITLTVAP